LAAENLFLRKQLVFYQERKVKPRRADNSTRFTLVLLGRWFNWRDALIVVKPRTFLAWHRKGFRLFWRWKSEAGRRPIPAELQQLIRRMARENPTWGEERIANELLLKLGLRASPRTIRKYMPKSPVAPPGRPRGDQRWTTFLRNHARDIIACDFCIAVTATFRILYVLVVMEHASRRLIRLNATAHPTAAWTLQQLRETIPSDHCCRFIIHDNDAIFSSELNASLRRLGLKVITTPVGSPQANSLCERLIGTLRRECLDWIIPLGEGHLRRVLVSWMAHYNRGRPHSSLGPGIPDRRMGDLLVCARVRFLVFCADRARNRARIAQLTAPHLCCANPPRSQAFFDRHHQLAQTDEGNLLRAIALRLSLQALRRTHPSRRS
jgi:transposase InsO family protein